MTITETQVVYTDDADPTVRFTITDQNGEDLIFTPELAFGEDAYVTATWEGDPAPVRVVSANVALLDVGTYTVYLKVPNGKDMTLGFVWVTTRT